MNRLDNVYKASQGYNKIVIEYMPEIEYNKGDFFSTDKSFLMNNFTSLIKGGSLINWALPISNLTKELGIKFFKVLPIFEREYTKIEIDIIKLSLHTLISLNQTILLQFTKNDKILEENYSSSNLFISRKSLSIESSNPYLEKGIIKYTTSEKDRFEIFADPLNPKLQLQNSIYKLSLKTNYYNTSNSKDVRSNINKYYSEFLFRLQSGKCAISNSSCKISEMEVDHIVPCSKGGTNTIINLQLIDKKLNKEKNNKFSPADTYILEQSTLEELGLYEYIDYIKLAKRDLTHNPFNVNYTKLI